MGVYGRDWVMDWHGFLWSWLVQREGEAGVLGGGLDCLGFGLRIFRCCSCSLGVLGGNHFPLLYSCLVLLGSFSAWFFLLGVGDGWCSLTSMGMGIWWSRFGK